MPAWASASSSAANTATVSGRPGSPRPAAGPSHERAARGRPRCSRRGRRRRPPTFCRPPPPPARRAAPPEPFLLCFLPAGYQPNSTVRIAGVAYPGTFGKTSLGSAAGTPNEVPPVFIFAATLFNAAKVRGPGSSAIQSPGSSRLQRRSETGSQRHGLARAPRPARPAAMRKGAGAAPRPRPRWWRGPPAGAQAGDARVPLHAQALLPPKPSLRAAHAPPITASLGVHHARVRPHLRPPVSAAPGQWGGRSAAHRPARPLRHLLAAARARWLRRSTAPRSPRAGTTAALPTA